MNYSKILLKYLSITTMLLILNFILSCSKSSYVNIVYYHLAGKAWQEIRKQDINGTNYTPSFTTYYFYPDFRLAKRCYLDPFCVNDNNGTWSLTANNQYLTMLTNSGFITAEIILITENTLVLKPTNTIYTYTFTSSY